MSEMSDASTDTMREMPFEFRGEGLEYFRIWIVNILLTIITLGIYSAWAKVRNEKYFYNHMFVDGHNFDYLANPVRILIGRLIALGVFILFVVIGQFFPVFGGLILLAIMFVFFPWILLASLRFRNRYSSYKNIRFNFHGTYGGVMLNFIVWPLIGAISFGTLMPIAWRQMRKYIVENSSYGTTPFAFDATIGDYYMLALKLLGVILLASLAVGVVLGVGSILTGSDDPTQISGFATVGIFVFYFFLFAYFTKAVQNLQWNNTGIRVNCFNAELATGELMWLYFTNVLILLITFGLGYPVVKVRVARYYASRIQFVAMEDLDTFIADEQEQQSAIGQEIGEFFDFDIGL